MAAGQSLQAGPYLQESPVGSFQEPQHQSISCEQAQRPQDRNGSPHGSKRCGTRHDRAITLPGVETGEQRLGIERAILTALDVDEANGSAPVEAAH